MNLACLLPIVNYEHKNNFFALLVHSGPLRALFKLMFYEFIYIYALMCRWMNVACSVSLYVAISYFIWPLWQSAMFMKLKSSW